MKLIDRQYAFVERQLRDSAASVGIDLEKSGAALIALAFYADAAAGATLRENCQNEDDYIEACRLTKAYNSKSGHIMLQHLGNACVMEDRQTFFGRSWETDDLLDEWLDNCKGMPSRRIVFAHRVFCDYAMWAGIASNLCAAYANPKKPAIKGALVRAGNYKKAEERIVEAWEREIDKSLSAEKAADELLGRPQFGKIGHRKIADTIRKAKKMHGAHQKTQIA